MQVFEQPRVLCINPSLPDEEFIGSGEADYQKCMYYLHRNLTGFIPEHELPINPNYNGGVDYKQYNLQYGRFSNGSKLEGNNTSIVTCILYQGVLFVCPGDIEPKGWAELWSQVSRDLHNFIAKAHTRFLVAPHHGRESGYSKEMMNSIQPHVVFISDKWGASTTHFAYYSEPLGLGMENNQIMRCLSTKTKGRILCQVNEKGFAINQFENERTI